MHRVFGYGLLFAVLVLLQVFFLNGLNLSIYVVPLIYVAFIGMLPTNINSGLLLILGLMTGIVMDFFTGLPALNTIASLFTAFIRPGVLRITVGKESASEANVVRNGNYTGKSVFLFYLLIVFAHCSVFFILEALAWSNILYVLLKILISGTITLCLVLLIVNIYPIRRGGLRTTF